MGVSYLLFTLNDETADWLRKCAFQPPSPLPESRFPTLSELKEIVQNLDGYRVQISLSAVTNTIDLRIVDQHESHDGWSTTIWAHKLNDRTCPPEDGDMVQFSFHKGSPELAVLIAAKLTGVCGPLVLISSVDCEPLLVTEGLEPRKAVEEWFKD